MRNRFKVMTLLVLVLSLVAIPAAAQDTNTFTFGTFGNPVQLDPAVVTDGISFRVATQGCESLLEFVPGETAVQASLATDWEVNEDGTVWTLQLRDDVTFHDGTPFNADAVVFNFDRWRNTENPYHFEEQAFEYYNAQFNGFDDESVITNVEATGEYEVTFTLDAPLGAFLNNLAMPMFSIASPAAIEEFGVDYGTPAVGYVCTGPYEFVSWESDVQVELTRFADYWGEVPGNVDQIFFRIIPDSAARFAALQAGEIDMFEQPNVEDIQAIEESEDLSIILRPPFNVLYLAFNYQVQEFRDPLVREAISMAINRQEIVDAFYPEGTQTADTMNPPTIAVGYNDEINQEYDPDRARELLAEAGFPDGISEVNVLGLDEDGNVTDEVVDTIPVQVFPQPVVRPYNPDGEGIGDAMVSYLQDVGINAELAPIGDWSTYLDLRRNGELIGLYQLGWTGDNGDPDNFVGYFFADVDDPLPREGYYQNAEVAALLQEARVGTDVAERNQLYLQAAEIMAEETARVYIA
ncbi:ABC transporter substrate-binding protein, partial [candidate division GN15 bacterium]|nr:ABC transporter substrate-binding protein [candidate division GN15 bacterium]